MIVPNDVLKRMSFGNRYAKIIKFQILIKTKSKIERNKYYELPMTFFV